MVTEWLEEHKQIKLEFPPAYAPNLNLNLIERYWRFAKGGLVWNKYYKEYKRLLNHTNMYID